MPNLSFFRHRGPARAPPVAGARTRVDPITLEGMELLDAHGTALALFDRTVHRIGENQWQNPTPCTEWTVRDVLGHLTAEQLWAPHLLHGATMAEVGDRYDGDVLGDDPVGAWERACATAREAWLEPGATEREVHLSFGTNPATVYGWQMAFDLAVHAWDIGVAIGAPAQLPDELAEQLHERIAPDAEAMRGVIFADAVTLSGSPGPTARLLALTGRNPEWKPR